MDPCYPSATAAALSVDVFRLILACLPRKDLLNMTCVSHLGWEEARKELLMRPIKLLRIEGLISFLRFALAGDIKQMSYIRELSFTHMRKPLGKQEQQDLLQVVGHCTNLKVLALRWCDILLAEDCLALAISSIRTLESLVIWTYDINPKLCGTIWGIVINAQSSLRSIQLPVVPDGEAGAELLRDIAQTHNRIEELKLAFGHFVSPKISFSWVRSLNVVFEWHFPPLRDLYECFPSIREITIAAHSLVDISSPSDVILAAHEMASSDYRAGHAWRSLDLLRGSIDNIWALGILCPVRSLDIDFYDASQHGHFVEALSRHRPRKLTVAFYYAPGIAPPLSEPNLLLYDDSDIHSNAGVKYLFVKMMFSPKEAPATSNITDFLRPIVASSRVECVHFALAELFNEETDPDAIVDQSPGGHSHPDVASDIQKIDTGAIARDLAEHCASIRTVAVTLWLVGHSVWSVQREDGQVTAQVVEPYYARGMLMQEERRCLAD
ncbi:hypothetical protein BD413DRAFT_581195 [Trametes elegans]|nr:hypothetical protein BD413DRAFT_581195 [Trametes elegans]